MAITKSAKKAHRASLRKREFNVARAKVLKATVKSAKKTMTPDALSKAYQAIDKAAAAKEARTGKAATTFEQAEHVALWLEFGTTGEHAMAPREFFFRAGRLEERANEERMQALPAIH